MIAVHFLQQRTLVAVYHRYPSVYIDQQESLADLGSLSPRRFTAAVADAGRAEALNGILRRAQEGDRLGRIESPGASVGAMLFERSQVAWPEMTLVAKPEHPPRIDVEPGVWRWDLVPPIGTWLDLKA